MSLPLGHHLESFVTAPDGLALFYRDYGGIVGGDLPILCLHGLTRNSRDFENLAPELAKTHRVVAPDMRGRGKSAYDPDYSKYQIPIYAGDVAAILEAANIQKTIVIGTSMGGLIAMALKALKPNLLAGVILNDVGPDIDPQGLARISAYAGKAVDVQNWQDAARQVCELNSAAFPDYGDEDWLAFAHRTFRESPTGLPIPDYDRRIGDAVRENAKSAAPPDLWPLFALLKDIPVLAIRGETSDILSMATLEKMHAIHPGMTSALIPGRGHAPSLDEPESRAAIAAFLENF